MRNFISISLKSNRLANWMGTFFRGKQSRKKVIFLNYCVIEGCFFLLYFGNSQCETLVLCGFRFELLCED